MLGRMLKSWNFDLSVFFLAFKLRFHTNKKRFTTKAYDRCASGDCGTSSCILIQPAISFFFKS